MNMTPEQKAQEEQRREACWDARMRWKVIQDTITWADAQATVRVNTKEHQLRAQRRKLAAFAEAGLQPQPACQRTTVAPQE